MHMNSKGEEPRYESTIMRHEDISVRMMLSQAMAGRRWTQPMPSRVLASAVDHSRSFPLYTNSINRRLVVMSKQLLVPFIPFSFLIHLPFLRCINQKQPTSPSHYILHALNPLPSPAYGEGCSPDRRTFGT